MGRKSWMTKCDEFFDKIEDTLIPATDAREEDSPYKYLWEDYRKAKKKLNEISETEPGAYCYTLIEDDGKAYIIPRWHFVNRMGYFISTKKVEDSDMSLRYL